MNDERAAGEPLGELLRLAEMRIKRPLWKGPKGTANRLLESIRNLEWALTGPTASRKTLLRFGLLSLPNLRWLRFWWQRIASSNWQFGLRIVASIDSPLA
jgi:hypothetical protein